MTIFLTPAGEPFFGGTYFPPEPRHGLPSFKQVLLSVAEAWDEQRGEVERSAAQLAEHIRSGARLQPSPEPLGDDLLGVAQNNLRGGFDPQWGGWGRRPKFPPAPVLEFLLRRDEEAMTRLTLDSMILGGMWDVVGGGFHRYSVDERWLVPHFEKMLYDNALLASVYLHAARRFGDERYRRVADLTIDYVLRELALEGGGFASAQDADTEGVEGLTFTWAPGEGAPGGTARAVRARALRPARRARRGDARAAARAPRAAAEAASRRQGNRILERPDARGARPGRAPSGRRPTSPAFSSAICPHRTDGCTAPGGTASRRERATSRTTPTSHTG